MELGGVIIVAAVLALLGLIPLLVARRTAITQNREGDRYSERLRLLRNQTPESEPCEKSSGPLLAVKRTPPETNGGVMAQACAQNPAVRAERRSAAAVREIAKLRARRAARLAAESAAGRRRLLVSAVLALLTLVLGIAVAASSLSWAWVLIPASLLIASLVASRMAAIRSQKVGAAELELLGELRSQAPARRLSTPTARGDEDGATAEAGAETAEPPADSAALALISAAMEARASEVLERPARAFGLTVDSGDDTGAAEDDATGALASADDGLGEADPMPATASVERRTWSVHPVPAPSYAMRGRIVGRAVHADTDLRGIPKVDASVPARPLRASVAGSNALSTEEVVADQAVALDLDSVLESRRAQ